MVDAAANEVNVRYEVELEDASWSARREPRVH